MNQNKLIMKVFKYVRLDCVFFTAACLILSLLSACNIVQNMDYKILLQLFFYTTVFSLVMFLTGLLLKESKWKELIIGAVNGLLTLLMIGGGLFRWFPWRGTYIMIVIGVFLVTYLLSYGLLLSENFIAVNKINQLIRERRDERIQ